MKLDFSIHPRQNNMLLIPLAVQQCWITGGLTHITQNAAIIYALPTKCNIDFKTSNLTIDLDKKYRFV